MEIRELATPDRGLVGELILVWDPATGQEYLNYGDPVSDREFVAVDSGEMVGWISGHHGSDSWGNLAAYEDRPLDWTCSYIVKLFVKPEKRSKGVGTRLVHAFERDALASGSDLSVVFPDESDDLVRVRAFYRRCGYLLMDPCQEHAGMQPWLMAKTLPSVTYDS